MKLAFSLLLISLCAGCAAVAMAAAPTAPPTTVPAVGPKNEHGLTAVLVGKTTYTLSDAQSGEKFRETLKVPAGNARGRGNAAPQPPAVDLTLRIANTTDKEVSITVGGDGARIDLKLVGPGAVTVQNAVAMTREFRMGIPVAIAPGKTHDIKISSLAFGMRNVAQSAFWTEPGEYTLTATQVYTLGETQAQVESAPVKIAVEKAK